jgi:peptidoglycan/xylan/chitin deacetylase (PgdA/CDA1 family)
MKTKKNIFILILTWLIIILLGILICKVLISRRAIPSGDYSAQHISYNDTKNSIVPTTALVDKSVKGLPILMYHFFYDKNNNTQKLDSNYTEISAFEEQMKYLAYNGYYYPTWNEVYEFIEGKTTLPPKSVVITVDDGDPSFFDLAVPILKKYNVKATSFLITTFVDDSIIAKYKSPILEFESHSNNMHRAGANGKGIFLSISHDDAYNDLMASEKKLGSHEVFCYPFGDYNNFTKSMLTETGYKLAVTTNSGRVYPGLDPLTLPRVRMSKGESLDGFISSVK